MARPFGSAVNPSGRGVARKLRTVPQIRATIAKLAALAAKARAAPPTATRIPPNEGPTARATLKLMAFIAIAGANASRGTVRVRDDDQAGEFSAAPAASNAVRASRSHGPTWPNAYRPAKRAATRNIHALVRIRWRRRFTRSASAPAGTTSKSTGSCAAAWIRLTISASGARSVMTQALAVDWTQVPSPEIVVAVQNQA